MALVDVCDELITFSLRLFVSLIIDRARCPSSCGRIYLALLCSIQEERVRLCRRQDRSAPRQDEVVPFCTQDLCVLARRLSYHETAPDDLKISAKKLDLLELWLRKMSLCELRKKEKKKPLRERHSGCRCAEKPNTVRRHGRSANGVIRPRIAAH